jgi:RNA polymerase sigma-70 factor (ECF subfamily)
MHTMTIEALESARAAWPGITVAAARFNAYALDRAADGALGALHLGDLYLACACADGDLGAIAELRRRFGPAIRHAAQQVAPGLRDEVEQRVLTKLLVAEAGHEPDIARYNGLGKLATWLQVVARREACNALRSARRGELDREREAEILMRCSLQAEDELMAGMKRRYQREFKRAFEHALARLSPRERNLLRYECVDRLTIEQIARVYGVSASSVARWRARCREQLLRHTKEWFRLNAAIDADELESVLGLIASQLELSLARVLPADEVRISA